MAGIIPEVISNYRVYLKGSELIGISGEVALPDFEAITDTMSGPGILGEMEAVAMGHFKSMEMEVPFRTLYKDMFKIVKQSRALSLTFRGSTQTVNRSTTGLDFVKTRIVVRGRCKGITGGKAKIGTGTASSVKLEIYYILIEMDGVTEIELDKLNFIYKVRGTDLMKKVRKMC